MNGSGMKTYLTSSAIAITCVGVALIYLRRKFKPKDAIQALNYLTIRIVTNEKDCNDVIDDLRRRIGKLRAIGFDCEWVTDHGKRRPVGLLQLSSADGFCGLFQLSQIKTVPESLKNLLEDEKIYKVGVVPSDDANYLRQDYSVDLKSTLDIRHIAVLCGHKPGGLAALTKTQLNILLDKSWRIRCSDWDAVELTQRQINYAAADAHVAIKIFAKFLKEYYDNGRWSSWLGRRNNKDIFGHFNQLCWKYLDLQFKTKQTVTEKSGRTKDCSKEHVTKKKYPHATRSKPLYHNCFLEAPDGELLCTIDNKKALWYVQKELADKVKDDPLTVRLHFEPAGRSVGDVGRYYQLTKENKCVVCGATNSYIRKNVVPREYRKYFPELMKEHSSHDVVLLCSGCHQRSNMLDRAVRERLAERCAAPCSGADHYTEDAQGKKIRSAARALCQQSRNIPESRRKELEVILLRHYTDHTEVTQELLRDAAHIQVVYENSEYESHGLKVVEHFLEREGLLRLEEMWREHFLAAMRPKYMPELWSIKHNEERLRVKWIEGRLSQEDLKLIGPSKSL